jgi:uncharacterized RDD family membrane protein YckC
MMIPKNNFRRGGILLGVRLTTLLQRFTAKGIDLLIVTILYFLGKAIHPLWGALSAGLFAWVQDSFGQGQSIGKRIMGLRVIDEYAGGSCTFQNSFLRNLTLGLFFVLLPFNFLWGLSLFVTIPVFLLEVYLLINIDTGVRFGDVMGNTQVIEYYHETDNIAH